MAFFFRSTTFTTAVLSALLITTRVHASSSPIPDHLRVFSANQVHIQVEQEPTIEEVLQLQNKTRNTSAATSRRLITSMSADERPITTKDIEYEDRQVDNSPEDVQFAIQSSESGFARTTRIGITVQKGATATLTYKVKARAIDATTLACADHLFRRKLTRKERHRYYKMRTAFNGGLDIPFLKYIGADLTKDRVLRDDMNKMAQSKLGKKQKKRYNRQARAAKRILTNFVDQTIEIEGTLTATGLSDTPTTAFAFIRLASVEVAEGQNLTVVTTDNDEVVAGTSEGDTTSVHSGKATINILNV